MYRCAQFIQRSRGHYFQPFRDSVKPVSQSTPCVFPALTSGFKECLPPLEQAISEFPRPLYQNEVEYSAYDMEMIFYFDANKIHFFKKGCILRLILKVRVFWTGKWPFEWRDELKNFFAINIWTKSNENATRSTHAMYVLWFNFILGLNFISLCFWVW